ncbi:PHD zinc finger-like protein, putative [Medicago truncatula]|uniref:PHD zinc finger-like protein, putative n=1 Tax=Medicago truncatula TaxID=3880 RepID=A0A072VAQ8_MEDTR|nr:PHD zinc finger-like protein, putative [Medicago truncatula]
MKLGKPGKRFLDKLKDLLDTRIMEGLKERYVKGQMARKQGEKELQGMIKDSGILCYYGSCRGNHAKEVVSPTIFELDADSANKRPPMYTYLENGNFLRDIMNACSSLLLDTLDEVVQMVLGDFTMQKSNICFNCRDFKCTNLLS